MKTTRNLSLLATGMFVALSAIPASALTIGFSPSSQTVPLGSNPQVDLIATLNSGESLGGWDLFLNYDPAIITLDTVVFGTALGFSLQDWDISNILLGQVGLTEVSLENPLPSQPTSFTLATLGFSTNAVGTSALTLSPVSFTDGDAQAIPITSVVLQPGSITVRQPNQTVPEGGNLAVVALPTLLGLLVLSKRSQNAKH